MQGRISGIRLRVDGVMMRPGSDVLAIEHLYASRERFVAYVRNRVDEPELAEDIVHDSLLRALRAAPDLREHEAPRCALTISRQTVRRCAVSDGAPEPDNCAIRLHNDHVFIM